MHGRPRRPKGQPLDPDAQKAADRKLTLLKTAGSEVLRRRRERRYDDESMKLAASFVALNPEVYTVWNYRREASRDALAAAADDGGENDRRRNSVAETELALTAEALKRNPKSYAAWHHRQWVVSVGRCDLNREFSFVESLLNEDSRNFHAWNYRQFLAATSGGPGQETPQQDVAYSKRKIEQDFSNFSAWHLRTKALTAANAPVPTVTLQQLLSSGDKSDTPNHAPPVPTDALDDEYAMCHSAFATDAEDSCAWLYHRWLTLSNVRIRRGDTASVHSIDGSDDNDKDVKKTLAILDFEIERIESDHLVANPEGKWPLLAVAWLLETRDKVVGEVEPLRKTRLAQLYTKLEEVDPQRKGYYRDVREGKAVVGIGIQRPEH